MSKTRVYELAKELKLPSKDIIEKAKQLGISYNSHMSTMEDGEIATIKASISIKKEATKKVVEKEETPAPKKVEAKKEAAQPKKETAKKEAVKKAEQKPAHSPKQQDKNHQPNQNQNKHGHKKESMQKQETVANKGPKHQSRDEESYSNHRESKKNNDFKRGNQKRGGERNQQ